MSKKKKTLDQLLEEALVPENEQPYEIPEKWEWVNSTYLFDIQYGKGLPINNLSESGYTVYGANGKIGFFTEYTQKNSKVLMTCRGATCGTINVSEPYSFVTNNSMIFTPKWDVDINYIRYLLLSQDRSVLISGSAQPQITVKAFSEFNLPLPNLEEQKRIADKIEILFAKIDEAKLLIDEVRETFKIRQVAILEQAFNGKLTVDFKIEENFKVKNYIEGIKALKLQKYNNLLEYAKENDFKKPSKPKSFEEFVDNLLVRSIPTKWGYATLGQVVYDFKYGTSQKSDYSNQGQPVIRIPNIGEKYISIDDLKFLSEDVKVTEETVEEGDLLIIRSNGSRDLVGKCAIVDDITSGYAYASYLIRMRPIGVNSKFIYWLLKSNSVKNQLFSNSKSSAGINNINTQELASIVIPLPSLEEQNEIVKRIEYLINKEKEVICSLPSESTLEGLKQAILSKAFKGELGTNDPADEPAIELLKLILQEKL